MRRRVLFIGEGATLAHIARPLALAKFLDPEKFEVHFACDPRFHHFCENRQMTIHALSSNSTSQFLEALAKGKPVFDFTTYVKYAEDDIKLLNELRPDVVVGDFRLSLSISARKTKTPYISVANAYWGPTSRKFFPLAQHPMIRVLGVKLSQLIFDCVRPVAFRVHSRPLTLARRYFGLPPLAGDPRQGYTDGDFTIYADHPELIPIENLPDRHRFVGPLLWEPECKEPSWWNDVPNDRPIVYLTLGSSGDMGVMPTILQALGEMNVSVLLATAGRPAPSNLPGNVFTADFLPGTKAARRADLVIGNGGSLTCYQALNAGTPVLGITSNMDQMLNMEEIVRVGAGMSFRSDSLTKAELGDALKNLLLEPQFTAAAQRIQKSIAEIDVRRRFLDVLEEATAATHQRATA